MVFQELASGKRLQGIGAFALRYSLVFFFVASGLFKFTPQEAAGVQSLIANSPVLFWIYRIFDVRHGSEFIGVIEITLGLLVASRPISALLSAIGSLGMIFALCTTLSFLFTTPGLDPQSPDAGFIMKDLTLLGAAIWTAGEALAARSIKNLAAMATA